MDGEPSASGKKQSDVYLTAHLDIGVQHSTLDSVLASHPAGPGSVLSSDFFRAIFLGKIISRDSMTAALLSWWTVPMLNVVIGTHPVLVRAVLQKKTKKGKNSLLPASK